MADESKLLELELEVFDICRRIMRLEGDYSVMDSSLKSIGEQVAICNANFDRFWKHEWPAVSKAIVDTNTRLGQVAESAVEERIKVAVAAEKAKADNEARAKETQALKAEADSQKSFLVKMLVVAAAGGGASQAVIKLLSTLVEG